MCWVLASYLEGEAPGGNYWTDGQTDGQISDVIYANLRSIFVFRDKFQVPSSQLIFSCSLTLAPVLHQFDIYHLSLLAAVQEEKTSE